MHVCTYTGYVYINEHLSVSLMSFSILCVQLIAKIWAGACVFLRLANRSMLLHTNVSPLTSPSTGSLIYTQLYTHTPTCIHTNKVQGLRGFLLFLFCEKSKKTLISLKLEI